MEFVKLSQLVGSTFTVTKVWGLKYKCWDDLNKKMLVSETFEKGFKKEYEVDTDKGKLGLSKGQMGQLLEVVSVDGLASLVGNSIKVGSNGKTGIDSRYYFDLVEPVNYKDDEMGKDAQDDIDISDIPF